MSELIIPFVSEITYQSGINQIAAVLANYPRQSMANAPWKKAFPYQPKVAFAIAYAADAVFIQYDVQEKLIAAVANENNGAVYRDACVEFFIGFDDSHGYYNFEFNCIGTALAGFGKDRSKREFLPVQFTNQIKTQATIQRGVAGADTQWQLTVAIPTICFCYTQLNPLQGKQAIGNFYKCGDLLPQPHYLAWSNIEASAPNFHLPAFFGKLSFK